MSTGPPRSTYDSVPVTPSEHGWADAASEINSLNVPPRAQTVNSPVQSRLSSNAPLEAPSAADHSQIPSTVSPSTTHHGQFPPVDQSKGHDLESEPYSWMEGVREHNVDDDLHDPTKPLKGSFEPMRAILNVGTLVLLCLALLMLFVGYPVLHHYTERNNRDDRQNLFDNVLGNGTIYPSSFPVARANSSVSKSFGRDASMLIDPDTPSDVYEVESTYSKTSGKKLKLVFSDEFETDGRSFYPGEDPFWEAVDLHYWATNNYEWYDPAAVYTQNGSLRVRLDQHSEHNLNFRGGMLQSWNKFCFRGGLFQARVQLPGYRTVGGLWPAIWTMGNLGRAGYGATTQGTWPYSYDVCDVGTLKNQTAYNDTHPFPEGWPNGTMQLGGATMFNSKHNTRALSFLPGQKLSRCTCKNSDHPGPWDEEKQEYVGRAAPEIDMFEAQAGSNGASLSQSCQMAPFNWQYNITHDNTSAAYHIYDWRDGVNVINMYNGEATQQSLSGIHLADQDAVQYSAESLDTDPKKDNFALYSMEYQGGPDGYVAWTSGGKPSWELYPQAIIPDSLSHVGQRQFPVEPMYLIINLGISSSFGTVEWDKLAKGFPFEMAVDWVRVYQDPDHIDVGCDPKDMPTADYINRHIEAYTNANLTIWGGSRDEGGYGASWPLNKLHVKGCDGTPSTEPGDPDYPVPNAPHVPSNSVTDVAGAEGDWIW